MLLKGKESGIQASFIDWLSLNLKLYTLYINHPHAMLYLVPNPLGRASLERSFRG
jgi:hypothetical protein